MDFTDIETWELLSYVVTVIGLPFAIIIFISDYRKERQNEEEEVYQRLADQYSDFQEILLENSDLRLFSKNSSKRKLTNEQIERKLIIFDLLISLFEQAYILVYEEKMPPHQKRLWSTWEDYIIFWVKREDFRKALPKLLVGEDPDFRKYILKMVAQSKE
ncbi:MAG: hypothetical protein EB060_00465 [Proteobacteria bacterium]|nr:hypothetical protein [Pseudomonadota bacterium]